MAPDRRYIMSKAITRLFDDYSDAKASVHELERIGVSHDDVSIVANNAHGHHDVGDVNDHGDVTRGASTGAVLGGVGGLLAGLGLLAIPGLGPIVAAGWLASTAAGAAIGGVGGAATGSLVGALKNAGHSDEEAHVYSEGVRRGGTLVSARVPDDLLMPAEAALNGHHGVDAAARGAQYRQRGWSTFDETAAPFSTDQIDQERATYRVNRTTL
jgi:hypothetical protein